MGVKCLETVAVVFVATMLVSSAPALAAPAAPTPPLITHPWKSNDCSSMPSLVSQTDAAGHTTAGLVCQHGPAWGSALSSCPKGKTLTLLLNNKWVCTKK
jgi:hypothetical protein